MSEEVFVLNSTTPAGKLFTPLSFAMVESGIYRSAYPVRKNYPFLDVLHLKTMICISAIGEVRGDLKNFIGKSGIELLEIDIKFNQEPFVIMDVDAVQEVINIAVDPTRQPCLIFCTNGKVRTSCVVGCLRKQRGWSMSGIIEEFERFAEPEGGLFDEMFIQRFPSKVFPQQLQQHSEVPSIDNADQNESNNGKSTNEENAVDTSSIPTK